MQTEYLNLVTDVQDQFTSPLTRLGGLLEANGTLADRLNPIRIRVNVHDQELKTLSGQLAALEGYDIGESLSTSGPLFDSDVSEGMDWMFGDDDDFQTASDIFEDSLSDLESSVSDTASSISDTDIDRDAETYIDSVPVMGIGAVGTMNIGFEGSSAVDTLNMGAVASGGSAVGSAQRTVADGGGRGFLNQSTLDALQKRFGFDMTGEEILSPDISPADLYRGSTSPLFQLTVDELGGFTSQKAIRRALDVEGIAGQLDLSPHQLAASRMTMPQLLQSLYGPTPSLIAEDMFFEDWFDTRTLQWERLKESFFDIRIGMTQFYDFLAALMPLMFVFIGAMPAVISALTGLGAAAVGAAGGLASIAGLGLMGVAAREAGGQPGFEDITDVLSDIPDEFFSAFRDTADRLAPTFERGLGGLTRLFDELAAREHALIQFTQHAEDFGAWMIPFLANTTEKMLYLASASRDLFSMIAGGIEGRDILGGMAASLERALPYLSSLTALIVDSMPGIVRFSTGMLRMANFIAIAASQVGRIGDLITRMTGGLIDGHQALGIMTAGFFSLMSATFLATKISAIFRASLFNLIAGLVSKQKALGVVNTLLGGYSASAKIAATTSFTLSMAIGAVTTAIKALLAATVVGAALMAIGHGIVYLTDHFLDLEESVSSSTDALREFDRQQRSMGSGGFHTGEIGGDTYVDVTEHNDYHLDAGGSDDLHNMEERLTWLENGGV